jgi:hypothetical protein
MTTPLFPVAECCCSECSALRALGRSSDDEQLDEQLLKERLRVGDKIRFNTFAREFHVAVDPGVEEYAVDPGYHYDVAREHARFGQRVFDPPYIDVLERSEREIKRALLGGRVDADGRGALGADGRWILFRPAGPVFGEPITREEAEQREKKMAEQLRRKREAPLVALVNAVPSWADPVGWRAAVLFTADRIIRDIQGRYFEDFWADRVELLRRHVVEGESLDVLGCRIVRAYARAIAPRPPPPPPYRRKPRGLPLDMGDG